MFEIYLQFLRTTDGYFEGVSIHLNKLLLVYVLTISTTFKIISQLL